MMVRKIAFSFIAFFVFFPSLVFSSQITFAQEQNQSALGIAPAIVELVLTPGKRSQTIISVSNVTNFPLPIKGSVKSFAGFEQESMEVSMYSEIFDSSSWMKIEPTDFILQPRERKEIKIIINPPLKAEPGGHYATVYFQPLLPVEVLSPQTAYLSARIGVLTFLVVKGDIQEKASLENLPRIPFRQFGPIDFKIPLKNEGNIHLNPSGEVLIKNIWGKEVAKLNLSSKIILPHTIRDLDFKWDKRFLLGKYHAQINISYGTEHQKLTGEIDFWVIPWLSIILVFGVLTTILIFFIILRKRMGLALRVLLGKAEVWELKKLKLK